MGSAKYEIIRKCEMCGEPFMIKTLESRYCSRRCGEVAYRKRKADQVKLQRLNEIASKVPETRQYVSVAEAHALFGISKDTIHRLIKKGVVGSANTGVRQTRVSKDDLMKLYPLREISSEVKKKTIPKKFRMEPEDCYTIGEIRKKFRLDESTVYTHIRKYSIPMRQIGNYVYVPKSEIDELYKGMKI